MQNGTHRNGSGNGVPGDAPVSSVGHDLLWDGLSPAATKALGQPLEPSLVSQRKGRAGRNFPYLKGHVAIDQANEVFGFGGWGYEPVGDVTLRQIETVDPRTGEVKRIHAYSATVRVTVPGASPRSDVGFHTVADESGEGHETAFKGAVTDGLKRALRSFGDRFGNGLHGDQTPVSLPAGKAGTSPPTERGSAQPKGVSGPVRGNHQDETQVRTLRKRLVELGAEQGFDEDQMRTAVADRMGKSLDDLDASELAPLVEAAANKLRQMKQAQAA